MEVNKSRRKRSPSMKKWNKNKKKRLHKQNKSNLIQIKLQRSMVMMRNLTLEKRRWTSSNRELGKY